MVLNNYEELLFRPSDPPQKQSEGGKSSKSRLAVFNNLPAAKQLQLFHAWTLFFTEEQPQLMTINYQKL